MHLCVLSSHPKGVELRHQDAQIRNKEATFYLYTHLYTLTHSYGLVNMAKLFCVTRHDIFKQKLFYTGITSQFSFQKYSIYVLETLS